MSQHSNQGKLRLMVGFLVIGLVASACSSALAKTTDLGAGCDLFSSQKSVSQQAEVAVGDLVKVTLCSNPTTGFSWQEPEFSDTAVVSLVDKTFGAAVSEGTSAPLVGAPGTDSITLKATAKGSSNMVLKYSQPWVGGTSAEWTYTLAVTVR
jgi:predicted secreted protein